MALPVTGTQHSFRAPCYSTARQRCLFPLDFLSFFSRFSPLFPLETMPLLDRDEIIIGEFEMRNLEKKLSTDPTENYHRNDVPERSTVFPRNFYRHRGFPGLKIPFQFGTRDAADAMFQLIYGIDEPRGLCCVYFPHWQRTISVRHFNGKPGSPLEILAFRIREDATNKAC